MALTNAQMVSNRFRRYAIARATVRLIQERLRAGGVVQVCTHLKAWLYQHPAQAALFEARWDGARVRQGKSMVSIDGCLVRLGWKGVKGDGSQYES